MSDIKKRFVKLLINRRINHISKQLVKKISSINLDDNAPLDPQIVALHEQKWGRIFSGKINLGWLKWYTQKTGINSPDFIPENIFYTTVEPILNNSRFAVSYSDKNFYDLVYPEGLFPEIIIRNIDGLYYKKDFSSLYINSDSELNALLSPIDRVFVKPAMESGGGRDVELFILKEGNFVNKAGQILTFQHLNNVYNQNFIIQKALQQHSFLEQFNLTSLNTMRVLTYRSPYTNLVNVLQVVLRVGAKDQFLDNSRAGGFSIGINSEGMLNKFAYRKDGSIFEKVNEVNLSDNEFIIPFFDKIQLTAKSIAERNIHHRMLALDMAIDNKNNIRCVEVNNKSNEINFHQLNNGPLFGDFTDEVISYCETNKENLYKEFLITTIPNVP